MLKEWLFKKEMEEIKYLRKVRKLASSLLSHSEVINPEKCSNEVMQIAKDLAAAIYGLENK